MCKRKSTQGNSVRIPLPGAYALLPHDHNQTRAQATLVSRKPRLQDDTTEQGLGQHSELSTSPLVWDHACHSSACLPLSSSLYP